MYIYNDYLSFHYLNNNFIARNVLKLPPIEKQFAVDNYWQKRFSSLKTFMFTIKTIAIIICVFKCFIKLYNFKYESITCIATVIQHSHD